MQGEHAGHRRRMFEKLLAGEELLEQEHLEMLLFSLIPRKNTNDVAHKLLAQFGTVFGVFAAPINELVAVDGIGMNVAMNIRCFGLLFETYFKRMTRMYEGQFNSKNFAAYVRTHYVLRDVEVLDVYLLGKKGEIVDKRRYTDELKERVRLAVVDFSKMLLRSMPSGVVMVHNHPEAPAVPSEDDDKMTKRCQRLCNLHGTFFCDHYIYGDNGIFSYCLSNRLREISENGNE